MYSGRIQASIAIDKPVCRKMAYSQALFLNDLNGDKIPKQGGDIHLNEIIEIERL